MLFSSFIQNLEVLVENINKERDKVVRKLASFMSTIYTATSLHECLFVVGAF
jgi:hypothetical protein